MQPYINAARVISTHYTLSAVPCFVGQYMHWPQSVHEPHLHAPLEMTNEVMYSHPTYIVYYEVINVHRLVGQFLVPSSVSGHLHQPQSRGELH